MGYRKQSGPIMAPNLARKNLQTLPRSTSQEVQFLTCHQQPPFSSQQWSGRKCGLDRQEVAERRRRPLQCFAVLQNNSTPMGRKITSRRVERFAVCYQYPKRNILETSVWTTRVSRGHRKPSTIDVTESRTYQTCGWPLMIISPQEPLLEWLTLQDLILCKHHVAS